MRAGYENRCEEFPARRWTRGMEGRRREDMREKSTVIVIARLGRRGW